MKSGAATAAAPAAAAVVAAGDVDMSTLAHQTRGGLSSLLATSSNKPAKFVISRPIRGIMLSPLQVKVLVPRAGRSVEYQLSRASPDPTGSRPKPGAEDPAVAQALKAAREAIYVSVQAQRATDEDCGASMCPHTHFDLVLRLLPDCLRAAHLLCKVVYQNVRGELKEMGPYLLHAADQVSSYRLEEMNCKLSDKTGHHHVYLLLQLVSAEAASAAAAPAATPAAAPASRPSGDVRDHQQQQQPPPQKHLPSHAQLPDFSIQWSPLATLRLVGGSGADPTPVYCVPQIMALCCAAIRDLLPPPGADGSVAVATGELVLQDAARADLLLLARLTYRGTTCAVTVSNVRHVLRLAARFRVPHLLATADSFLCDCVRAGVGPARRAELSGLATQFDLQALSEALGSDL